MQLYTGWVIPGQRGEPFLQFSIYSPHHTSTHANSHHFTPLSTLTSSVFHILTHIDEYVVISQFFLFCISVINNVVQHYNMLLFTCIFSFVNCPSVFFLRFAFFLMVVAVFYTYILTQHLFSDTYFINTL